MSDWQQIIKDGSIATLEKLADKFGHDVIDVEALKPAFDNFQMRITPAALEQIKEVGDPMWNQYIPSVEELEVVDGIVAKSGPNAITRAAIIAGLRTVHDFEAGGMLAPVDVANRKAGACIVIVQVQNGKWVQVDPVKKGTFDCDQPNGLTKVRLDPVKAYKPS